MSTTYFSKRGEQTVPIKLESWDEAVEIVVRVPTNYENDHMLETYTEYGAGGEIVTHGAELLQNRLTKFIVDLPFDVPVDTDMTVFKTWRDASVAERVIAIGMMEYDLRDAINNRIGGASEISEEEAGN